MANHPEPHDHPEHPEDPNKNPPLPPPETSQGGTADLHAKVPTPSDSFIDLGIPGGPADPFGSSPTVEPKENSDISIVEWAALVEETPPSDTGAASATFDRPSDKDWVAHAVEPTVVDPPVSNRPPTHPAIDMAELFADPIEVMADTEAQPGTPAAPPQDPLPEVPAFTEEASDEQESLAADLDVVRQTFDLDALDSHKNLTPPPSASPSVPLAPEADDGFEQLVDLSGGNEDGASSGSFSSSGVDLQQLDSGSFEHIVAEEAAAAPSSSVDLGSAEVPRLSGPVSPSALEKEGSDAPVSSRDLIAEAVESGVDMQQPTMEIVDEEALAEEALEANEVIESSGSMKQPLLEIVEEEEALEASEVVESSGSMKQPLLEITDEPAVADEPEEALVANEVVESSGSMKQPLLEIADEPAAVDEPEEALEAGELVESSTTMKQPLLELVEEEMAAEAEKTAAISEVAEDPSSAVDLGSPVETQQLNREEMDALLAGQEMGAAAEQPVQPDAAAAAEPPAPPVGRKTIIGGQSPIRTTQLQGINFDEEEVEAAEAGEGEVVEEPVAEAGDVVVDEEVVAEAEDVVLDDEIVEEPAIEPAAVEEDEVVLDARNEYEDVSEIVLKSDHPTIDSSLNLGEGAAADADPEEVQLGEPGAVEDEETAAAEEEEEKPAIAAKPPKQRSRALALVGGGLLGLLIGAGLFGGAYFAGLLPATSAATQELQQQKTKVTGLEQNLATARKNAEAETTKAQDLVKELDKAKATASANDADLKKALAAKQLADMAVADLNKKLLDEQKNTANAKSDAMALAEDKKKADATITDLNKKLADEQEKSKKDIADLTKQAADEKKKADMDVAAAKEESTKLAAALKTEKDMVTKLKEEVAKSQDIVNEKDPQGMIRKLQGELSETKAQLKDRLEPSDMLAVWLPILENRPTKELSAKAQADAERVLKDAKAKPGDKAKARALIGLSLRNDNKFADAQAMLEEAKKGLGDNSAWQTPVAAALKEVSNPAATFKARADALRERGDYAGALKSLTDSIDALPPDKGADLLAERSLLRLEEAKSKKQGPLAADDLKAALDDATKADAAGSAQGSYAVGRVAEEMGHWPEAVTAYRKAIAANPEVDARGSRYRVALARALQQMRTKAAPPKDDKMSRLPALDGPPDTRTLAVLVTLMLQPPKLPAQGDQEAQELADAVIKANMAKPGSVPFDVLSQALVVKGQYTEALKTYAEGLKAAKKLTPEYADGLLELIEKHPVLKRPQSDLIANPFSAEKHYGAGLRWYNERNFASAEKEFIEAIKNDGLDARYHYFLGLARLAQNKQEGLEDFAQGAKLEVQERPSRAAVSAALERVQGPMRETLNEARRQAR